MFVHLELKYWISVYIYLLVTTQSVHEAATIEDKYKRVIAHKPKKSVEEAGGCLSVSAHVDRTYSTTPK